MVSKTKASDFKVSEKLNEDAHVAEILLPKTSKARKVPTASKPSYRRNPLRRTGEKAPDVIMDVYMGVLSEVEKKPKIQVLE